MKIYIILCYFPHEGRKSNILKKKYKNINSYSQSLDPGLWMLCKSLETPKQWKSESVTDQLTNVQTNQPSARDA